MKSNILFIHTVVEFLHAIDISMQNNFPAFTQVSL